MKRKIFQWFISLAWCCFLVPAVFAQEDVNQLEDIVITGTKTPHTLQDVPVQTLVITHEEIQKKNAQNVMDLLKEIPGIHTGAHSDVFGTYTWLAKMRGLDFDSGYALILVDGQRAMGCGQSGGMGEYGIGLNQVPVELIERIEVVKGPGSALYGSDAMAGIVNIITRKIPSQAEGSAGMTYGRYEVLRENADGATQEAGGSRNLAKAYVAYGDRISEDSGYFLHYNYEQADDIESDPRTAMRHAFFGKMDARVTDRTDISVKAEVMDYEKQDRQDEESWRLSGIVDYRLAQNHALSLKGYTYNWDFTHGYPGYAYGYKKGEVGYNQAELQYTWNTSDWNTLVAGGEAQVQGVDYIIENPDGTLITVDEDVKTYSLYAQDEAQVWDILTLVGGARFDHHSTFGNEINPKFSFMLKPGESTTLRASAGTSFKSPTLRQLYYSAPYRHGSFYAKSNPDLKPEKALGFDVSLEQWFWSRRLSAELGYFRNEVDDMVVREDTGTLYNGLPLMEYKNVEKALTQGFEFLCRAFWTQAFTTSVSYTLTDTENRDTGKELTYVPRHTVSLSPAYDWEKWGLGVSARFTYTSSQYTDSSNTERISGGGTLDAKVYKRLSGHAKVSIEGDDLFESAPAATESYHSGRTIAVKFDIEF